MRRTVALVALVIVLVLIVIGVHSCSVSQANSALRNYNDNVASLIRASNQNGDQMFSALSGGVNTNNVTTVRQQINNARLTASNQLGKAQDLGAPGAVSSAQQNLVQLMRMRRDAIGNIASNLPQTLRASTATSAVNSIAAEMARLYASDVLYKDYVLPNIFAALKSAGIGVGGTNGEPYDANQLVPNVQWLLPSFVASQLKVSAATSSGATGPVAPGPHGHALDGCSVGATTLSTTAAHDDPQRLDAHADLPGDQRRREHGDQRDRLGLHQRNLDHGPGRDPTNPGRTAVHGPDPAQTRRPRPEPTT